MKTDVPKIRIRATNQLDVHPERAWVLYWMTAFRRTRSNYALQYATDLAKELRKPLVILEALRIHYRWASDRFHRFIIEGMVDNSVACQTSPVLYYPYVEQKSGEASGLLETLAKQACTVVTDDFPCFFHPQMLRHVSRTLPARLEAVDANCLMPLRAAERTFTVAHSYRRWMQKELPNHLEDQPEDNPLDDLRTRNLPRLDHLTSAVTERWRPADLQQLLSTGGMSHLPIDHSVSEGVLRGGATQAAELLARFANVRLTSYDSARNEPDEHGSSELSPYLHFGQIGPHEIFLRIMETQAWNPGKLKKPHGKAAGFWGVSESAEAFLDQLCCWREIGFNMCYREPRYDRFDSLPDWSLQTLHEHENDPRPFVYSLDEFEEARTHDPIWNAAQRQLVREGRIHNYLRMLWGKKILHWTASPQEALHIMIELNNKYGLDGRDPNSYSGIFWVLGRYDRAWGPEREIFGKIRYMTSENTAKKHPLKQYLRRFAQSA